jgi:GT2 family glycosyltransferase
MDNHPNCILASACNKREEIEPYGILDYPEPDQEAISEHPDFSCFIVPSDIFKEIGRFDENFRPAYFEDNDFHYRIDLTTWDAHATTKAPYYHYGSITQNSVPQGIIPGTQFEANRAYFVKKWGGLPGAETYRHPYNNDKLTMRDWINE